jgi:acyl CoA:acetate/3-ketoacid CoA transferase beta subunit
VEIQPKAAGNIRGVITVERAQRETNVRNTNIGGRVVIGGGATHGVAMNCDQILAGRSVLI